MTPITSQYDEVWLNYGHLYIAIMKKEDGGIVILLFQSEAESSGLNECNEVWDHLNQI